MKGIIDFYETPPKLDYTKKHEGGQFYWAPFMFVPSGPQVARYTPNQPIGPLDVSRFDPEAEQPNDRAGTDVDEFHAIDKFKLRRVVILSSQADSWTAYGKSAGDLYLVAPAYTLWDKYAERYKYPADFIRHAIEYRYNSVFYLPDSEVHGVEESVLRLDQVGPMHATWLVKAPRLKLTSEALTILRTWFYYFVTGTLPREFEQEIQAYRELVSS
jgi:hypothetical protein